MPTATYYTSFLLLKIIINIGAKKSPTSPASLTVKRDKSRDPDAEAVLRGWRHCSSQ
jgi:hypothetical protein